MILDSITLAAHNMNSLRVEIVFESCSLHVDTVVCLANPEWENSLWFVWFGRCSLAWTLML